MIFKKTFWKVHIISHDNGEMRLSLRKHRSREIPRDKMDMYSTYDEYFYFFHNRQRAFDFISRFFN